jgi:hypothetical protein
MAEVSEDAKLEFVSREDFLALMIKDTKLCLEAMNLLGKERNISPPSASK